MGQLRWTEVEDGYESGDYRIGPARGPGRGRWSLEIEGRRTGPDGAFAGVTNSFHRTLRLAMAQAERIEVERVSRRRVTGYLAVAGVATVALFALAPITNSIELFVVTMMLVGVAVRSFANAAGLAYGDAWAWTRDDGTPLRTTWADRMVVRVMERLRPASPLAVGPATVRVLPPVDRR
jgi:hypothetical protein